MPQVLSKVHLGLREHSVDDCFWDPALPKHQDRSRTIRQTKEASAGGGGDAAPTFRSMLSNQVNWVLFGSPEQGFMTMQVGPFSALQQVRGKLRPAFEGLELKSLHRCSYLTRPFCSGMVGCWVDVPARKQVEPRRLAQRTLTKSRAPTTFPGVSAEISCVTMVSGPIF